MRKFLFAVLLMVAVGLQAMAQYGTDKLHLWFNVRNLPTYYVANHTYHVNLGCSKTVKKYVSYAEVCDLMELGEDWEQNRTDGNTPVVINFNATDFIVEGIHEDVVEEKVRRHGEEVIQKVFLPRIDYSFYMEHMFSTDGNDTYWRNNKVDNRLPIHSFRIDKRFHNPRDCHEFVRDNLEEFLDKIIFSEIEAYAGSIMSEAKELYLYYPTRTDIKIALFDSKKSPYYEKHRAAKTELKGIMAGISCSGSLQPTIKAMQPWINHFKEIEASLSKSDKKQKSAKADMIYNLAMIYYALEIYDVSRDYAQQLLTEYEDNAGKRIIKTIDKVQEQLNYHHLQSRHF